MTRKNTANEADFSHTQSHEKQSFFSRLRDTPKLRSYNEHVAAVHGLPLDAVQLLLRSKLPRCEMRGNRMTAGAIIKTLHDLRFWEPLVTMGLSNSFKLHKKALEEDHALLNIHQPDTEYPELLAIWTHTLALLEKTIPAPRGTRQAA